MARQLAAVLVLVVCTPAWARGRADNPRYWEHWWSHHQELFVVAKRPKAAPRTAGSVARTGPRTLAVQALRVALKHHEPAVRAAAAINLGRIGSVADRGGIEQRLRDRYPTVRASAAIGLGLLGDPAAAPILAATLRRGEGLRLRAAAALGLGLLGGPSARVALKSALRRGDAASVHRAALIGLSRCADGDAVALLGRVLTGRGFAPSYASLAAYALSHTPGAEAAAALRAAVHHPVREVQRGLALALGNRPRSECGPVSAALKHLVSSSRDKRAQGYALLSLGRMRDPRNTRYLAGHTRKGRFRTRPFAALALGLSGDESGLTAVLDFSERYDGSPSYSLAGVLAEGLLSDEDFSVDALLWDPIGASHEVVQYGIVASAAAGEAYPPVESWLALRWAHRHPAVLRAYAVSLALSKEPTWQALASAARRPGEPRLRRAAAAAIGETGVPALAGPLAAGLADRGDPVLAEVCAWSLGQLLDRAPSGGSLRRLAFGLDVTLGEDDPTLEWLIGLMRR